MSYGNVKRYSSSPSLLEPESRYQVVLNNNNNDNADDDEQIDLTANSKAQFDRFLLASAIASAKEQLERSKAYYATSDDGYTKTHSNLNQQAGPASLANYNNPLYSSNAIAIPSQLSSSLNSDYSDNNDKINEFNYKIIASEQNNDNNNNIIYSKNNDENDVNFDAADSYLAARIGRSYNFDGDNSRKQTTNYVTYDDNNNNDILTIIDDNQQKSLNLDQTDSLDSIEPLDEGTSANLKLINDANRPKPIVSTLLDDNEKSLNKDSNSKEDKKLNGQQTIGPNVSIGRVLERESDRINKEAPPSWQLFLSRIYETVFGTKPTDPSAATAPTTTVKSSSTTTTTTDNKESAEKKKQQLSHNNNNNNDEKHTKPSEVSSEQIHKKEARKLSHRDNATTTTTATNTSTTTTTIKKDLATGAKTPSSDGITKLDEDQNDDHEINQNNSNSNNNNDDKFANSIDTQNRDKKTVASSKKSAKFADVVEKVIEKNNKEKHEHEHEHNHKELSSYHPEITYNSNANQKEDQQLISLMRKSTFVLPIEDDLEDNENSQPTPALYATGSVYPLKVGASSDSPIGTIWAAPNNIANNGLDPYKAFSRHYHPGQPIYGFTPQVVTAQTTGFAFRQPGHGNDLYFLVMVGAFCVMAVAMVLAAGLFAYRVQQNRKSSTEMDYPTYGVVGPNSIAGGKLGASGPSFVGGYFASNNAQAFGKQFTMAGHNKGSNADLTNNNHNNTINSKNPIGCSSDNGFHSPNDSGIISSMSNATNAANSAACSAKTTVSAGASKRSPSDSRPPSFMASQQNAARIYHYQNQKQQMISSERNSSGRHTSASDLDSEEENEDGNYTVYECPGLASAHDMEIKNPLFNDDRSP